MAGFVRGTPDTLVLNRMTGFDRKATTRAFSSQRDAIIAIVGTISLGALLWNNLYAKRVYLASTLSFFSLSLVSLLDVVI